MCGCMEEETVRSRGHEAGGPDPNFLVCKTNAVLQGSLSPLSTLWGLFLEGEVVPNRSNQS